MNWPGTDGSLRELIKRGILAILEDLELLRVEMSQYEDRTDINYQVASLAEGLRDLETRVTILEQHKERVSWWIGLSLAVTAGMFLAYLVGIIR